MGNEHGLHNVSGGVDGRDFSLPFCEPIWADISVADQRSHLPGRKGALSHQAMPYLCKTEGDAERTEAALSCQL